MTMTAAVKRSLPRGRRPTQVIVMPFTVDEYAILLVAAAKAEKPLPEWLLEIGLAAASKGKRS